jgi:hypothetical protein
MRRIVTQAGDRVILPVVLERARGASCHVSIWIEDEATGAGADRSTWAHSFALFDQAAIDDDTGVASTSADAGLGDANGKHDATIPAADMAALEAGDYWGELECTSGTTTEKYLVKIRVTGRGKQPAVAPIPSAEIPLVVENVTLCDGFVLSSSTTGTRVDLPVAQASASDYFVTRDWDETDFQPGDGFLYLSEKDQAGFRIANSGPGTGRRIGYRAFKVVTT